MKVTVEVPKAFSVREENEFFAFQHLMARMNPRLMVMQVATGRHVNSGCTVFWGLVYLEGHQLGSKEVETALQEAGFDLAHNGPIQVPKLRAGQPESKS